MALHHQLSPWQKILLGILCFPLLPFYICVYCLCCKTGERKNEDDQIAVRPSSSNLFNNRVYIIDENSEGQHSKKKTGPTASIFKFPWDRSSLKSMDLDLKKFKQLDSFASTLEPRGSLLQVTQQLVHKAFTDLEKTRAIWMWICHHIEYDIVGYKNTSQRFCDPDDVFRTRKGVCAGYSRLFKQMCSIAGVKCEEVSGYSKGAGYQIGETFSGDTDHAWNMVFLEGCWHLLDSTWGAGNVDRNTDSFSFCYNEYYFLTHPALFIGDHYPENKQYQLLDPKVSIKHFEESAFIRSWFYNTGLISCHPDKSVIKTEKGKVSITIEGHHNMLFMFKLDGNERKGIMKLVNCGMKLEVYPQKTGQHELQLFAKSHNDKGVYTCVLEYRIDCKSIDTSMKIPECLHNPVGPSWVTEASGLVQPSHPDPIIYTEDGCCSICFALMQDLHFLCSLESDEVRITPERENRFAFITQAERKLEMRVRVPQSGTYVLKIFVKPVDSNSTSYDYLCNYLIICTNPSVKWPGFPLAYTTWENHYELLQPLDGVLANNSNVSFKLHIPEVTKVCIEGEKNIPLILSANGYWEGDCSTAKRQNLFVMIQYKNEPNMWHYVLKYDVAAKTLTTQKKNIKK